jgi:hypothetical protein
MKPFVLLAAAVFINSNINASSIDTAQVEKRYSKSQLIADVSYLTGTIDKVHPNMYHSISKKKYKTLVYGVTSALHDSMTAKESWPIMARLVGALKEGHSTLRYPENVIDQMKAGDNILFPVSLKEFDGSNLIVQADVSKEDKLRAGDKITQINGIAATQLIDTLSQHSGGLRSFRAINVCSDIVTLLYMYNIKGPYHIDYIRDGITGSAILNSLSWPHFKARRASQAKNSSVIPKSVDYSFNYLNKDEAYLNLNTLTAEPQEFKTFVDSCFTLLKNKPAKTLIIDLRRNGGGNSILAETLLDYITDRPFRMTAGVNWKVSQEYKNYLNDKLQGEALKQMAYYLNADNGTIIKNKNIEVKKPLDNKLRYYGKVIVLIGTHTFSSANMLANAIQDYKLATLVGDSTGEAANDYGELIHLKLPNTGLSFTTSTKQFIRANGDEKNFQPVLPQYRIVDNSSTKADEVLEFAKNL